MTTKFKQSIQAQLERLNVKPLDVAMTKVDEFPNHVGEFTHHDVLTGVNVVLEKMGQPQISASIMNFLDKEEAQKLEGKSL